MSATHDDYVNMRILVDVAEHCDDEIALVKLREYIATIEALSAARGNARSKLPIKPLRIADVLPPLSATRGGITFYSPTADFSVEAEQLAKRRDAIIELFRTINEIQWGNGVNDITRDDLDVISEALYHATRLTPDPSATGTPP